MQGLPAGSAEGLSPWQTSERLALTQNPRPSRGIRRMIGNPMGALCRSVTGPEAEEANVVN